MKTIPSAKLAAVFAGLVLAAGLTGCSINVDKDAKGQDKNVRIDTPFGGIHVNTNQTTAADVGLPAYPGAQTVADDDKHKSADVHMGFGQWELRVRAVSYETTDKKDQVIAFYKKALGRYGDVLTCQNNSPVGTPTKTSEGLTCSDNGNANVQVNDHGQSYGYHSSKNGFELKAGSERHQHVVGFEEPVGDKTRFALVAIDLPNVGNDNSNKSN